MSRAKPQVKRILLVIHGARADNAALRHVVEWVRAQGHVVIPRVTWETGDAERFAREGAHEGVSVVIAAGGDGTVNEVANGLAGGDVPLGIIPLGTANDFARQVGIPMDAGHAMDIILQRPPIALDAATMNGRVFINMSTGGLGAEATAETSAEAKASLGALAYAITGARKLGALEPWRARFSGPEIDVVGEFLLFAVGNTRSTGGGTVVTPRASLTDGLLDVCVVEAMPLGVFARLLLKLRRGEHLGEPGVHYWQVPSLLVEAETPVSVNLDGEPHSARVLDYRVHAEGLRMHVQSLPGDEG